MQSLILTLHIIVCVLLVILILLQAGKEGMGVIFGGGNSTVFGSTGAGGVLVKLTTLMALIFVVTSLSYTYVTSSHPEKESTILDVQIEGGTAPAAPSAAQPATKPEDGQSPGLEKKDLSSSEAGASQPSAAEAPKAETPKVPEQAPATQSAPSAQAPKTPSGQGKK